KTLSLSLNCERERHNINGDGAREAAAKQFTKAPEVLGGILEDQKASPRHRIEAAKELRATAHAGDEKSDNEPDRVIISINLGADVKPLVIDSGPLPPKRILRKPPMAKQTNGEEFGFADAAPPTKQPQELSLAQRLLDWLMQCWPKNPVSRRDISNHGPRPIRDKSKAIEAAETLERHGWLVPAPTHRHDRRVWQIVRKNVVRPTVAEKPNIPEIPPETIFEGPRFEGGQSKPPSGSRALERTSRRSSILLRIEDARTALLYRTGNCSRPQQASRFRMRAARYEKGGCEKSHGTLR